MLFAVAIVLFLWLTLYEMNGGRIKYRASQLPPAQGAHDDERQGANLHV